MGKALDKLRNERMMKDENIFKIKNSPCIHNEYYVDDSLLEVTCALCSRRLNPIWCLMQHGITEHRLKTHLQELNEKVEKIRDKVQCRCQKCGQITPIVI